MHLLIEFLPLFFGVSIAQFFRFIKPLYLKKITLILLPLTSGITVNLLSKEGIDLMAIDIVASFVSMFCFIILGKYFKLFWREG